MLGDFFCSPQVEGKSNTCKGWPTHTSINRPKKPKEHFNFLSATSVIHWLRVDSSEKSLYRHLFNLLSTGGDTTSTNMRDYFDKYANVLQQK